MTGYAIRETLTFEDGRIRRSLKSDPVNTPRGWSSKVRIYKTRGGAQRWINKRVAEIAGSAREGVESYEIIEY